MGFKHMEKTSNNPLNKYFRQPAIYMNLPSKGTFWSQGSLELPVTGEIPVYPMTARDEITIRTPDALMNGSSVVDVIHSCCPVIKDAWKMPSVDVDAVLIGIRIASYGHDMNVDTQCPGCQEENSNSVDLRNILGTISCPDFSKTVPALELKIKLKPQAFFGVNRQNTVNFEEQKIMEALSNADLPAEDKAAQVSQSMDRLIDLSISAVCDSTEYVELPDGHRVTEYDFISDFYKNSDAAIMKAVQNQLSEYAKESAIKNQKVRCSSCDTEYEVPLEFDYANFFAVGS